MVERVRSREQHSPKAVERFIFFSDAVFAFALTLLASKLRVPAHSSFTSDAEVLHWLSGMIPSLFIYVIGFIYVAALWIRHHRLFERLQNYDHGLIALNFLLLLCVSLVPFSIDLFNAGPALMIPLEIYGGWLGVNGLVFVLVWGYTRRVPGLLPEAFLSRETLRRELVEYLGMPVFILGVFGSGFCFGPKGFGWGAIAMSLFYVPLAIVYRRRPRLQPNPADSPGGP